MYRAQRLAEYLLYDGDPHLIDTELDQYLRITAEDIKESVSRFLDIDNRVVLDIIPSAAGAESETPPEATSTELESETLRA
jgi:predicted Zn-dependent peptidase